MLSVQPETSVTRMKNQEPRTKNQETHAQFMNHTTMLRIHTGQILECGFIHPSDHCQLFSDTDAVGVQERDDINYLHGAESFLQS
jgi:hypothetical protein